MESFVGLSSLGAGIGWWRSVVLWNFSYYDSAVSKSTNWNVQIFVCMLPISSHLAGVASLCFLRRRCLFYLTRMRRFLGKFSWQSFSAGLANLMRMRTWSNSLCFMYFPLFSVSFVFLFRKSSWYSFISLLQYAYPNSYCVAVDGGWLGSFCDGLCNS